MKTAVYKNLTILRPITIDKTPHLTENLRIKHSTGRKKSIIMSGHGTVYGADFAPPTIPSPR
jgi:hypothetical protein